MTSLALLSLFAAPALAAPADADPNPFRKSYVSLEYARNYPVAFSQDTFEPGGWHPVVGYLHDLDARWIMGLTGNFKLFRRSDPGEDEDRNVALWTLAHETMYVARLDHPTYLLLGPKLLYLLPSRAARLPLQRDDSLQPEVGLAVSGALIRHLSENAMLMLRADRWRGTRTMKLHGVEVALGLAWALE